MHLIPLTVNTELQKLMSVPPLEKLLVPKLSKICSPTMPNNYISVLDLIYILTRVN